MLIRIIKKPITKDELKKIANERYGDLVKAVVDIKQRIIAIGGELHADEESVLLEQGSHQQDLWGINFYPDQDQFVEFDSMINIRPAHNNRTRGVDDLEKQKIILKIVDELIIK
ncbi:MAG: DUF5674 family protein [bacterium]